LIDDSTTSNKQQTSNTLATCLKYLEDPQEIWGRNSISIDDPSKRTSQLPVSTPLIAPSGTSFHSIDCSKEHLSYGFLH
jgi:hypothetical protein